MTDDPTEGPEVPARPASTESERPGRELGKVLREEIQDQDDNKQRRVVHNAWKEAKQRTGRKDR